MAELYPETLPTPRRAATKPSGFTLVEILVVIAIIAILVTISFPVYTSYIDKAKITLGISTLGAVREALEEYANNNSGSYPPAITLATGEDGQGKVVLPTTLRDEFKQKLFSLEGYVVTTTNYTLTALANDTKHTTLVLKSGQVITQGP